MARGNIADPDPELEIDVDGRCATARHVAELAKAIRRKDMAEADLCLDLIGRVNSRFAEVVARGRAAA